MYVRLGISAEWIDGTHTTHGLRPQFRTSLRFGGQHEVSFVVTKLCGGAKEIVEGQIIKS